MVKWSVHRTRNRLISNHIWHLWRHTTRWHWSTIIGWSRKIGRHRRPLKTCLTWHRRPLKSRWHGHRLTLETRRAGHRARWLAFPRRVVQGGNRKDQLDCYLTKHRPEKANHICQLKILEITEAYSCFTYKTGEWIWTRAHEQLTLLRRSTMDRQYLYDFPQLEIKVIELFQGSLLAQK